MTMLGAAALQACGGMAEAVPASAPTAASPAMQALAASLGRGINFGNMLDAPNEGDWGLKVTDEFLNLVGPAGLTRSVRLPVRWSNHASADANARIDPVFFARVDSVVNPLFSL